MSVFAVPPLARDSNGKLCETENEKLIRYLEAGGINLLLYGGNAVFYHLRPSEYAEALTLLSQLAGPSTAVVPAVGPTYGLMMDHAEILKDFDFPTAMVLPQRDITDPIGIARGVRKFAEAYGKPIVLYLKFANWMSADLVESMISDGLISWIKYAVVREDPSDDPELRALIDTIGGSQVISGIGEQPAIVHMRDFGVQGYTSGCVCLAPSRSMEMLRAIQRGDFESAEMVRKRFAALEDLRNQINPIRVLHHAVELGRVAKTGPLIPLLSEPPSESIEAIRTAATELHHWELEARQAN